MKRVAIVGALVLSVCVVAFAALTRERDKVVRTFHADGLGQWGKVIETHEGRSLVIAANRYPFTESNFSVRHSPAEYNDGPLAGKIAAKDFPIVLRYKRGPVDDEVDGIFRLSDGAALYYVP